MRPIKRSDKKGGLGIIIFFTILSFILVLAFVLALGWTIVDIASDEITPIMSDLGVVGESNLSEISGYTFEKLDTVVQSFNWIIAIMFVLSLGGSLVFIFISGYTSHPAFMGFFIVFMIFLIFLCVIMSNVYQDIYSVDDEIGSRLREQSITSFLILNSPMIMSFIAVIGGIIMFGRQSSSEGGGGYGV